MIPGQHQFFFIRHPYGQREEPVKSHKTRRVPYGITVSHQFGAAVFPENAAAGFQLGSKLTVVVDCAVHDYDIFLAVLFYFCNPRGFAGIVFAGNPAGHDGMGGDIQAGANRASFANSIRNRADMTALMGYICRGVYNTGYPGHTITPAGDTLTSYSVPEWSVTGNRNLHTSSF